MKFGLVFLLSLVSISSAFDYFIDEESDDSDLALFFTDTKSSIDDLKSFHNGDTVSVDVTGIVWAAANASDNSVLTFSLSVDGNVVSTGTYDLTSDDKLLPSSITIGEFAFDNSGTHTVTVELELDGATTTVEDSRQSFASGASIVPLLVVLLLAMTTQMVELSLLSGIFVGACMVAGNIKGGFFSTLDTYVLKALVDESHGFVYLFTFFLSGLVGMMEKSGGFAGFTKAMTHFATTPRAGQLVSFLSGCVIFFDDYANTLIVGESMRPLTDMLSISREKLSFLVDATSAPVASITPISSWIGFELGLIQDEISNLQATEGTLTISTSSLAVFVESVKYRYYPIFMLMLLPTLIVSKRDYGPMLIAERKTVAYDRTDGGDGKGSHSEEGMKKPNAPLSDTPPGVWNMLIPLLLLVFLILWLLIQSGTVEGESQTLLDKFEGSDSYVALLYGSMGAALLTLIFYQIQFKQHGDKILWPTPSVLMEWARGWFREEDPENPKVKPLLTIRESVEAFLHGMGHVFGATIVLTLAWAAGDIMRSVGTDRLFAAIIGESVAYQSLPTLSFLISFFMALATGTSWGTMAIMFPLLMRPTYESSSGNPVIFYATVAGILSGAVAGDHVSPISDTTVLSALATDCDLLRHVVTQAPYVFWLCFYSIIVGTLPVGYNAYPNGVAYLLGYILILAFVILICRPVISKSGSYDPLTELFLRLKPNAELEELKQDTIAKYEELGAGKAGLGLPFLSKNKTLDEDEGEKPMEKTDDNAVDEQPEERDNNVSIVSDEDSMYIENTADFIKRANSEASA